jgi:trehalose 6-phosphate synthase
MSRLVIVSNRVADLKATSQKGGLAVGLADAVKERGGLWFGWDGTTTDQATASAETVGKVAMVATSLTEADYEEYYLGYANNVLWPLCHYRLDLVNYRPDFFRGYRRVNKRFAYELGPHLRADDTIWVHDYHLIPLARQLRRAGSRHRIGFFLHIPFPPPDLLSASPNHVWLIDVLLDYDLVGFQSSSDAGNFLRYLEMQRGLKPEPDGSIRHAGRSVHVGIFPIGIDAEGFAGMADKVFDDVQIDRLRRQILGRKQVIGVDRLDYSKGLPDRLKAFERLLELHPEMHKQVSLLQIAPPTREDVSAYTAIRSELEGLTGAINGRYADFNWTPVRYIHRSVEREKLAALYRSSQVGFVTPMRDGMNLVAKEYVAAQNAEDPGVLVLSQFAGAAEELQEALIVNPFDQDEMARSLHAALVMALEERRERHSALFERVRRQDARAWLAGFLAVLEDGQDGDGDAEPRRATG